jgi:outer membrane biosynthesis protein TonB
MIPRFLVPKNARPPAADAAATSRRRPTTMDERTLVPAMLPIVPLDGRSTIPANLPLDSIAARVVVPRDLNAAAYGPREESALPAQPSEMDERVAVPLGAAPPEEILPLESLPGDLVELDVFMTGEVQFMPAPKSEDKVKSELVTRVSSIALHILVILGIILQPKLFPSHGPSAEQQEIARRQITVLLPPGTFDSPKPSIRPHTPPVHVDPRILREVAPPIEPVTQPAPERPKKELPNAPVPQPNAIPPVSQPSSPAPKTDAQNAPLRLETVETPQPQRGLKLPPRTSIEDSLRAAGKSAGAGGRAGAMIGPMPKSSGIPGSQGGGGGMGQGTYGNGYEILTPTEGVDFSDYMQRVLTSVRRNWYAVMPESAMLGDRGRVDLRFRIMKDGSVPLGEPQRLLSSGKEPLDRAAISAIRSSNPFQPLPSAFSGPYIELHFIFLYNLPLDYMQQ